MYLKILLYLEGEKGLHKMHIYGNSFLVVNWMKGEFGLSNYMLQPLFDESTHIITYIFDFLCFQHVYRKRNLLENSLSKEGLSLAIATSSIQENHDGI